tara:strand:- start:311 stop:511 length:201 start_codon:yes stop_codon:yes gene_type:complete
LKLLAEGINGVSGVYFIMDVLRLGLGYGLSAATEAALLPVAFGGELLKKISAADCLLGTTEFLRLV